MDVHKLLARQLNRLQLRIDQLPPDLNKWQELLSRINKTYQEADQDRYLIERSMDISSREMQKLNEKLEQAQHIAKMGYWFYDHNTGNAIWSKELYRIIDMEPLHGAPGYNEFFKLVHPDHRDLLKHLVANAIEKGINYDCEIQIEHSEGQYKWYHIVAHCLEEPGQLAGIIRDIHKEKEAEEKIRELNNQFVQSARRAGMSEVATSILHNIGNILNSSNLSINILRDEFKQPYYQKLSQIINMIQSNETDLAKYFNEDPKGKLVPQYLLKLSEIIIENNQKCETEISNIHKNLHHIKEIVSMQQCFSGVPGVQEKVFIPDIINTALKLAINLAGDIKINKELEPVFITADKSKLLQILINLIHNAKDAVMPNSDKHKEIELVAQKYDDSIHITVKDNGIGIDPENLDKVFSFGFTTKADGHGFGLHSAGLSTQEMGGSLTAHSEGLGKGAVFKLTLPSQKDNLQPKRIFNE
ncbi:Two-component sensor histidine kinase [Legionella quinlivanii]|uniref:histidine kinase n=1 Tax=Legionella quinlivanii TaxID=45073 RepID=A0A0W0XZ38_9GAMM|nr:ATP-binding protein [Legionella quinlivanii]KTD50008.1 Two-component sensor histidine kinase [Legionella quinlivanii]SEF94872.1 PAS fold-containing protein [Legionella quinlivanii DSM 21216]STY11216.1 Two-component sensor histidine kinase [Legionella quinlivanii]